jgi:uncharacterized protein
MEKKIKIRIGKIEITAELNPARVADLIWDVLPIHSIFNFWGDEIYFPIPIKEKNMENPSDSVQIGDLAYWPEGHCFCIFYGPTPISSPGRIKPASRVEIIGRLLGDPKELKKVAGEDKIMIEKLL